MLGERLKQARKLNNMTLKELENKTGLSNSNISNYENNKVSPTANAIILLCEALNISADWLLLNKEPLNNTYENNEFFKRYSKLTEREKGRIDQLIEDIEKAKPYDKVGNL